MKSARTGRRLLGALLIFAASLLPSARSLQSVAQTPPTQLPGHNALLIGTDWYPEQWPEERWETELRMIEEAHLNVARLAEFAWSKMEPAEGSFQFDWLERAV